MHRLVVLVVACCVLLAAADYPAKTWEMHSRTGWSEQKLKAVRDFMAQEKTAAVMIVQAGKVVDQWGDVSARIQARSVRKSFINALFGIHTATGLIDLGKTLEELGIQDNPPELSGWERQATILDLLRSRSGIFHLVARELPIMAAQRPPRGSQLPGAYFYYNNWDFNVLGAILEKIMGKSVFEDFETHIARPIGMEDYRVADGSYEGGPQSKFPYYMFRVSARDMARFGYLYLRQGRWNGKQILPANWVTRSTTPYSTVSDNDSPFAGYGLLWWTTDWGYSAVGADGHFIAVVPSKDLVIVHRVMFDPPRADVVPYRTVDTMIRLIIGAAPKP